MDIQTVITGVKSRQQFDLVDLSNQLHMTRKEIILALLDGDCGYDAISFSLSISKSTIAAAKGKTPNKPLELVVTDLPPQIKLPGDCTGFVANVSLSISEIKWLQSRWIKQSIREKLDEAIYRWRSQRK